ncbi:MAG TPA: hypothetical protein ENI61_01140 [Ignavibacteria bacterium]|nr:hypothetical protein [Ignavibacteria bacterium]
MAISNHGYKYIGKGLSTGEVRVGKRKFQDYLDTYPHLNKMTYYSLLEELVFHEALNDRIKLKIEQLSKARKEADQSEAIGSKTQKELNDNMDTQFKLKEKLGLFENKQILDAYKDFEELREDFKEYRRKNPNQFQVTCPSCAFIFFLKRRTDQYEEFSAPWFKDKVLCNPELWKLYKAGKITREDIANVLGTSPDYIEWLQEKIFAEQKGEK